MTNSINIGTVSEKVTLNQSHYTPDFTLRAVTDVQYLSITKTMYIAALRASLLQHQQRLTTDVVSADLPDYNSLVLDDRTNSFISGDGVDPRCVGLDVSSRTKLLVNSMDI